MIEEAAVKVVFTAKVKSSVPEFFLERARQEVVKVDGFLGMETQTVDGIETTTTYWDQIEAVDEWSRNNVHKKAKSHQAEYYEWTKVQILANQN